VVAYHFGFTDAYGRATADDGGKALRPLLVFLSAEAAGGSARRAVPGAVAVELVHNFSLLHDDVMDHDEQRRHRPTAWTVFGVAPTIAAGDALANLAHEVLLAEPTPERIEADAALTTATARMIAGQCDDLAFQSRPEVSIDDCLRMMSDKTGALFSCAASLGAIQVGGREDQGQALRRFGLHLGLAFQAADDILGIWGEPDVTGKPAANDLRERKKTLPVVAALASKTPVGWTLRQLLSNGHLNVQAVTRAAHLVDEAGGREWTLKEAERHARLARQALELTPVNEDARRQLIEVAEFVTARDF